MHEVVENATRDDLLLFIAARNLEAKEQDRARRAAAAKAAARKF